MQIAIYGAGGFGRELIGPILRQVPQAILCFVDDNEPAATAANILGLPVISYAAARERGCRFVISIAAASVRQRLAAQLDRDGLSTFAVSAPTSVVGPAVRLGDSAVLCDHVTLTADLTIGRHFHANIYSYVAHDCVIGDFVTFAPRVSCNGNVTIGDGAYLGTGAQLRQGITIGAGATVGMGAVVVKNVAPGTTVVGNPARVMGSRP